MAQKVHCAAASPCAAQLPPKACHFAAAFFEAGRFGMASAASGLRHPASASCLGRHSRLAGRCPNNSSLFPPLAAVVVVALWASIAERVFFICSSETPAGVSKLLFYGRDCGGKPLRRTFVCNPFFASQKGAQGLFWGFSGRFDAFQGPFTQNCSTFAAVRGILQAQSSALFNMPFP